jgi:nitronate monooxygenase
MFDGLRFPLLVAPRAGGPTTPELVAAVVEAGGSGFPAACYLKADALGAQLEKTQELTAGQFGVNLFVPGQPSTVDLSGYVSRVEAAARRYGVEPGEPHGDDDDYPAKLDLVAQKRFRWSR